MLKHMPENIQNFKMSHSSTIGGVDISEKDLIASGLQMKPGMKITSTMNNKAKMLQSQRIDNLQKIKEQNDMQQEEDELDEIKGQSIKGLTSQKFELQSNLQSKGCFSCL